MKKKVFTLLLAAVCTSTLCSCNIPFVTKYIAGSEAAAEQGLSDDEQWALENGDYSADDEDELKDDDMNLSAEGLSKEDIEAMSDPSKEELGWDGEWIGSGVTVWISGANSGNVCVDFEDEEMHNASLDEVSISGNTITGVYRITWEMYADTDDVENLPEQEWWITLVKSGGTIYYSRVAILTWYNENSDGTIGHTVEKGNTAVLKKVNVTEN